MNIKLWAWMPILFCGLQVYLYGGGQPLFLGLDKDALIETIKNNNTVSRPGYKNWYRENINENNKAEFIKVLEDLLEQMPLIPNGALATAINLALAQQRLSSIAELEPLQVYLKVLSDSRADYILHVLQAQYLLALLYITRMDKFEEASWLLEALIRRAEGTSLRSSREWGYLRDQLIPMAKELLGTLHHENESYIEVAKNWWSGKRTIKKDLLGWINFVMKNPGARSTTGWIANGNLLDARITTKYDAGCDHFKVVIEITKIPLKERDYGYLAKDKYPVAMYTIPELSTEGERKHLVHRIVNDMYAVCPLR